MKKDYYLVLQLTPSATVNDVRSAYRRLAMEMHPDTSGSDSERFLELREAYEVLGDPMRRRHYDQQTHQIPIRRGRFQENIGTNLDLRGGAEPLLPPEGMGWVNPISLLRSFGSAYPSADELFDRLWSNFTLSSRPKAERLENLVIDVPLSPQEAFYGGAVEILVPTQIVCPSCGGRGHMMGYECGRCGGNGKLVGEYPILAGYPGGLQQDYVVQMSLDRAGLYNFYLTVRFRPL